jgi:hypothetical protein
MQVDYPALAEKTVAITYPSTPKRPPLFRKDYLDYERLWIGIVKEGHNNKDCKLIVEDSDEGRALLTGEAPKVLTSDYLQLLGEDEIKTYATKYKVRITAKSTKNSLILGILRAIEEGEAGE